MYLSSEIKHQGHESDLILTNENLEEKIKLYSPDFVGYSIMTGDQKFYDDINRRLKKIKNFFSIAGGSHPTFFPEMLENSSFDAICIGEAENSIKELLENPYSKDIPNFHFKDSNKIIKNPVQPLIADLDKISFPDRDLVFKYSNIRDGPIKHFISSRGCPYNCSYCFNESYAELYRGKGKRVRHRSVDNLLGEVQEVVSSSPTKFVYFQDDTFILNKDWLKEFSEKYREKVNLPFHCHTRANIVNEDIVTSLSNAGCYSVHIAAESGNEEVRKNILNRKMSNEQIYSATKMLKDKGIKVMLQNILGLPFTNLKNDFETLELNIRCQPDYAWASIFQPYPKTELGKRSIEGGYYSGDFSDIGNNFFDESVLNIENKNEIANLQKLFAIAVKYPVLYKSGRLDKLIKKPYSQTREQYTRLYKSFRKQADKLLYGFDL